jgi:hypothetical protein
VASGGQADNDIDCHDIVEGKTQEAYHPPTSSLSSVHLVATRSPRGHCGRSFATSVPSPAAWHAVCGRLNNGPQRYQVLALGTSGLLKKAVFVAVVTLGGLHWGGPALVHMVLDSKCLTVDRADPPQPFVLYTGLLSPGCRPCLPPLGR